MATTKFRNIEQINALSTRQFEELFGNVIEYCPEATNCILQKRPFTNVNDLKNKFCQYIDDSNTAAKENILKKHPELGEKSCESLTDESRGEQISAGINEMTEAERHKFNQYNQEYYRKFGYPFIICARENDVASIIFAIQERLKNSRSIELHIALEEVKKICKLRINDIVC